MRIGKPLTLISMIVYVALSVLSWLSYSPHENEIILDGRKRFYLEDPRWIVIKGRYFSDEEKKTFLVLRMVDAQGLEVDLNGEVVFRVGGDGVASKIWRATFSIPIRLEKGKNEFVFRLWGKYNLSIPARPFLSDDPWVYSFFMNAIHTFLPMALSPVFITVGLFSLYAVVKIPSDGRKRRSKRLFLYFSLSQLSAGTFLLYYFTFPNLSDIDFYYEVINKIAALSAILMFVFSYAVFESTSENLRISRYIVPITVSSVVFLSFLDYRYSVKIATGFLPLIAAGMAVFLILSSSKHGYNLFALSMTMLVASAVQYSISLLTGTVVVLPIVISIIVITLVMVNMKIKDYIEYMRIAHSSKIDPLTGVYNRRILGEIELEKGDTVVFVDVNEFKVLNDMYGHDYGDKILRILSQTILENIKGKDYAVRYGGDEFLIILRDCGRSCAEEIMKKINGDFKERSKTTISYGISEFDGDLYRSIKEADKRMYEMKKLEAL